MYETTTDYHGEGLINMQLVPTDDFKRHPGPGYIYLFQDELDKNRVKIGLTKNPKQRIKGLHRSNTPLPFSPAALWWVSHMEFTEKNIHELLRSHRIARNREFFHIVPHNDSLYEEIAIGYVTRDFNYLDECLSMLIGVIDEGLYYLCSCFDDFHYQRAWSPH